MSAPPIFVKAEHTGEADVQPSVYAEPRYGVHPRAVTECEREELLRDVLTRTDKAQT